MISHRLVFCLLRWLAMAFWIFGVFLLSALASSVAFSTSLTMSIGACVRFRLKTHLQGLAYSRLGRRNELAA